MAYSTIETQLIKQVDRFAKIKKAFKSAITGGTNFWTLVDAAGDETYENRIKGTDITDLDTKFNNAKFGSIATKWFTLHDSYFKTDLGLDNGLSSFLDSKHWRLHEEFGEMWFEWKGTRLDRKYIWADEESSSNVLGTLAVGGTGTSLATLNSKLGNTRLAAKVTSPVGGGDFKFNITVKTFISSTSTLTTTFTNVTLPDESYTGNTRFIGALNVTYVNDSSSSSTVFTLSGTATGFKVNGYMLVVNNAGTYTSGYGYDETYEDFFDGAGAKTDDIVEYLKITAVSGSLVTTEKARHTYDPSNFTYTMAYPCFTGVSELTLASANAATAGAIKIVPTDDRTVAL